MEGEEESRGEARETGKVESTSRPHSYCFPVCIASRFMLFSVCHIYSYIVTYPLGLCWFWFQVGQSSIVTVTDVDHKEERIRPSRIVAGTRPSVSLLLLNHVETREYSSICVGESSAADERSMSHT